MNEGWNVIIRYDAEFAGLNIWFARKEGDTIATVQPIDMTVVSTINPGEITPEPTIKLSDRAATQFLQGLCDALVQAGYKPSVIQAHDKEMEATKNHLEDMRKLVMEALLPPELPPVIPRR